MPIVLGVDLGTTKITCIAVDTASGEIVSIGTAANDANVTSNEGRAKGHSEWRADLILASAIRCLSSVAEQLGAQSTEIACIGITGQQHGVVLVDATSSEPVSPLINWQDRRALEKMQMAVPPGLKRRGKRSAVRPGSGLDAGCTPVLWRWTLFELNRRQQLPANARALFIMDYFAAALTGQAPVTEPSCAGSSGVFDAHTRHGVTRPSKHLGFLGHSFPMFMRPITVLEESLQWSRNRPVSRLGRPSSLRLAIIKPAFWVASPIEGIVCS